MTSTRMGASWAQRTRLAALALGLALALGATGCAAMPAAGDAGPGAGDDDDGSAADGSAAPGSPDAATPVHACGGAGAAAAQPFGSHAFAYAAGSILPDHRSRAQLDDAVRVAYAGWKARHLQASCAGGRVFVKTGDGDATVSEATGYGMMILAYMAGHEPDARALFDGMYRYFQAHPSASNGQLMSWQQSNGCGQNPAASSAADADLDIAYALLLADKQWGSDGAIDYKGAAVRLLGAIRQSEVDGTGSYVRLGDWTNPGSANHYDATRSSDFMPGHFTSFEAAIGGGTWAGLTTRGYGLVGGFQAAHAPATGLLSDFIVRPTSGPAPAPPNFLERAGDGTYSFNACRVPWRIAVHYLTSGDARARTAVQKINTWLRAATGNRPGEIRAGYTLAGNVASGADFRSNAFVGPFGVGAMVDPANQSWLNAVWDLLEGDASSQGYYSDTLELLSMIAMSGNWWAPEAAPCPR